MIKFNSSSDPTIGVEIELQFIDANTLDLKNIAANVLSDVDKKFSNKIKYELFESMIEINTDICSNVEEVERDIRQSLNHLEEILKNYKATLNCMSLHPFAKCDNQIISNNSRYKRIMKDLQIIGRRFITQGLHVHIGINDCEKAIKVNNALRVYLPLLLAFSTSSPFFQGEDTGLYSYRTKIFESLPLAGIPDYLVNWNHFLQLTKNLKNAGIIKSVKDLWWEVRPHPGFGTVEIRACDIPITLKEIFTLVAMIQALVIKIQNEEDYPDTHIQILESNKWQVVRYGLEGVFIDPITFHKLTIREAINQLCELIEPTMTSLGLIKYIKTIEDILKIGTGSTRQRKLYNHSSSFEYMIRSLKEQFYQ
jgi:carboxylate-amine ligase